MKHEKVSRLYYLALFLMISVYFVVTIGGLVTSHEAGLAVPDWPLSYGQWMPPMIGNIFWEHGHRVIAGLTALLTLVMAVLLQFSKESGWIKRLAWFAVGAVLIQAVLGGVTVLLLLPAITSILHACLGQTFFCMAIALAYYLSGASRRQILSSEESKRLKRIALLTFAFIYIQLILGASVRHTHHLHVAYLHMLFALFVVVHVLLLILKISHFHLKEKSLLTPAILMGVFTFVQILLGVGSFVTTLMLERTSASPPLVEVAFTAAHQSMGALILGLAFYVVIKVLQTPAEILQSKK
jgi:cytochrome c oxidase assembly protein subunit 15